MKHYCSKNIKLGTHYINERITIYTCIENQPRPRTSLKAIQSRTNDLQSRIIYNTIVSLFLSVYSYSCWSTVIYGCYIWKSDWSFILLYVLFRIQFSELLSYFRIIFYFHTIIYRTGILVVFEPCVELPPMKHVLELFFADSANAQVVVSTYLLHNNYKQIHFYLTTWINRIFQHTFIYNIFDS